MPKKKSKPIELRGGVGRPSIGVTEQLLTGHAFFHRELTLAELAPLWKRHKKFLMNLVGVAVRDVMPDFFPVGWSGIPFPWGTRPWAWWEFDAPEPRRLLAGDPALALQGELWFGIPNHYTSVQAHASLTFESQPDYLTRLNLLVPG